MARKVLSDNEVVGPPTPIVSICETYGLNVYAMDLTEVRDDVAGVLDIDKRQILVNDSDSAARQAFTTAHELGHYLMHKALLADHPGMGILFRRPIGGESDPYEKEANAFAAEVLVPLNFLKAYVDQPVDTLAKIFGVSTEVVGYRMKALGLS